MKLTLLGAFAGAGLLAGCDDYGRRWALTAQEDYYSSEQGQEGAGRDYSNIGSSSGLFETDEQVRGTGGAGEADTNARNDDLPRIQGSKKAPEHLWLQQDLRVPFPPPELDAVIAMELGTGKPLRAGRNGAWVQGTYGVELGSGLATSLSSTSSSFEPQEPQVGTQAPPQNPTKEQGRDAPREEVE
jgi:hypothetical protein